MSRPSHEEMINKLQEWLKSEPQPPIVIHFHDFLWPCPHKNVRRRKDVHGCDDCDGYVDGWYCPKSPDTFCSYFTEERECGRAVQLRSGEWFQMPAEYKLKHESQDNCLFCGKPDERK